ncbi:MAG TPA: DUF488 domain-containing protein [Gemmatimonadota bacterium]|nr:DUF488 domain-containing protein [Gemmatimonadota bacterium]
MGERTRQVPPPCWTIGHSTLSAEAFIGRLATHGIRQVADVRRYPASRRYPHFNREILMTMLQARGIAYRWFEGLGGRRKGDAEKSLNTGLESPGFRSYADYARTAEFEASYLELLEWLGAGPTALMCAETLWWKCHRRLIADQLVARGGLVTHILNEDHAEPHRLWDLAVRTAGGLVYPRPQGELDLGT